MPQPQHKSFLQELTKMTPEERAAKIAEIKIQESEVIKERFATPT